MMVLQRSRAVLYVAVSYFSLVKLRGLGDINTPDKLLPGGKLESGLSAGGFAEWHEVMWKKVPPRGL